MTEHIWYNAEEDVLFVVPLTPTNYTRPDLFYFDIKF